MSTTNRRLLITLMALTLVLSSFINAFADTDWNAVSSKSSSDITESDIQSYLDDCNASTRNKAVKEMRKSDSAGGGTRTFSIDGTTYTITDDVYSNLQKNTLDYAKSKKIKDRVENMGADFSVEADIEGAGVALSGINEVVQLLVGILCYIVVIGMALFTAIDMTYINIPIFKASLDQRARNGGSLSSETKDGDVKFRLVTDDAMFAVKKCTLDNGKNPNLVYLKKRIIAYCALAFVIYLMFTGNIQLIVNACINFISGLISALSFLGN